MTTLINKTLRAGRFLSEDPTAGVLQVINAGVVSTIVSLGGFVFPVVSYLPVSDAAGWQWTDTTGATRTMAFQGEQLVIGHGNALRLNANICGQILVYNDNASQAWAFGAGGALHDTRFFIQNLTTGFIVATVDPSNVFNFFGGLHSYADVVIDDGISRQWVMRPGLNLKLFSGDSLGTIQLGPAVAHAGSGMFELRTNSVLTGTVASARIELHMTSGQTGSKYAIDAWTYLDHSTGTTQAAKGLNAGVEVTAAGTVTAASSISANGGLSGAGTITKLSIIQALAPFNTGGGTITTAVGLDIAVISGAATNWAIDAANALRVDYNTTASETRLLVWDVTGAALARVKIGAAGSGPGGVGRALWIT